LPVFGRFLARRRLVFHFADGPDTGRVRLVSQALGEAGEPEAEEQYEDRAAAVAPQPELAVLRPGPRGGKLDLAAVAEFALRVLEVVAPHEGGIGDRHFDLEFEVLARELGVIGKNHASPEGV